MPKPLIVARYFAKEQAAIDEIAAKLEAASAIVAEVEEENGGDDGAFSQLEKVNKANISARLKELVFEKDAADEADVLNLWLKAKTEEDSLKKQISDAEQKLDAAAYGRYTKLSEDEVKTLVVEDKWMAVLDARIHGEMDHVSQQLTARVRELAERYETSLPKLTDRVAELESKVNSHLERMGFSWN